MARERRKRPYGTGSYRIEPRTGHLVAKFRQANGAEARRTFRTESEANTWLNDQMRLRSQGVSTPAGGARITVTGWIEEWLGELRKSEAKGKGTTRRWGTMAGYEDKLTWFGRAYGRHRLAEITPEHIEALYEWLQAGVVPPNSFGVPVGTRLSARGTALKVQGIIHLHHLLGPMFRRARRRHLILENPMEDVSPPGIPPDEEFEGIALDLEAWRRLLVATDGRSSGASVLMVALLGTRRGETLGLSWSDVVLAHDLGPHLTIRRTLQRVTGRGLIGEAPKTQRSERTVAIPELLADALRAHRASAYSGPQFVFVSPRNASRPMDPGYWFRRVWSPLRDELGLSMRPHDLRHTLKTLLVQHSDPSVLRVEFIDQFFGWSKGSVASDYTHLRVRDTRPVADEIQRLASGRAQKSDRE